MKFCLDRILINIPAVIFLSLSCASQNSLIVGSLPSAVKCIAVMPFITKGDAKGLEKDYLSEFIVSDLFKEEITGIIHPIHIKRAYEDIKADLPSQPDPKYSADVGKVLGCDATLWGSITFGTIVEKSVKRTEAKGEGDKFVRIVAVEAFLVDAYSGNVNWYYDAKKTGTPERDLKTLAQISSEIVYGLIRVPGRPLAAVGNRCPADGLDRKLSGLLVYSSPERTSRLLAQAPQRPVDNMAPEGKPAYGLNEEEIGIYNDLKAGKSVRLAKLTFDGRTANISKEGTLYLFSIAKVMKAVGTESGAFMIESHIDSTMDTKGDMAITVDRAKNVKDFLAKNADIEDSQIRYRAWGGQRPILPNINLRSRLKNSRIELSLESKSPE